MMNETAFVMEIFLDVQAIPENGQWLAVTEQTGVISRGESEEDAREINKRMHDMLLQRLRRNGMGSLVQFMLTRDIRFEVKLEVGDPLAAAKERAVSLWHDDVIESGSTRRHVSKREPVFA